MKVKVSLADRRAKTNWSISVKRAGGKSKCCITAGILIFIWVKSIYFVIIGKKISWEKQIKYDYSRTFWFESIFSCKSLCFWQNWDYLICTCFPATLMLTTKTQLLVQLMYARVVNRDREVKLLLSLQPIWSPIIYSVVNGFSLSFIVSYLPGIGLTWHLYFQCSPSSAAGYHGVIKGLSGIGLLWLSPGVLSWLWLSMYF